MLTAARPSQPRRKPHSARAPSSHRCACIGGQKWVHTACLMRWQSTIVRGAQVLGEQRQQICSVCKTPFSLEAPRARPTILITPDAHATIAPLNLIVAAPRATAIMKEQLSRATALGVNARRSPVHHWIAGVYVITEVDTGDHVFAVNCSRELVDLTPTEADKMGQFAWSQGTLAGSSRSPPRSVQLRHFMGGPCEIGRATALALLRVGDEAVQWVTGELQVVAEAALAHEEARGGAGGGGAPATPVQVLVFWGVARWSTPQLQGEMRRGDWGLTPATYEVASGLASGSNRGFALWQALVAEPDRVSYESDAEAASAAAASATPPVRLPTSTSVCAIL